MNSTYNDFMSKIYNYVPLPKILFATFTANVV